MTAEFACGQILFNLKNSNLHYLIKETHLSAYITIRKKLIRDSIDNAKDDVNVTNEKHLDDRIRMENGVLKQEINDLKTILANIEIEKDEVEIKNETLERSIMSLDNKLEMEYNETKKAKDEINNIKIENEKVNDDLQLKIEEIVNCKEALSKLKLANEKLENKLKESEENCMMLENVVNSKEKQISELESKVTKISCENCERNFGTTKDLTDPNDIPSTSKCGLCEYESENENDMNIHVKTEHDLLCKVCDLTFETVRKLNMHMCRVNVLNPEYGEFYTKNWMVYDDCTRIFSRLKGTEVLFLHSKKCLGKEKTCPDLYGGYNLTKFDGVLWHLPLNDYFSEGKINWNGMEEDYGVFY